MPYSAEIARRFFLIRILIICIVALVGILTILFGPFRTTIEEVLQSMLAIGCAVLASAAVTAPLSSGRWRIRGYLAYAAILAALAMTLLIIWVWAFRWPIGYWDPQGTTVSLWAIVAYSTLSALTSMARLKQQWRWVRHATLACGALFALQCSTLAISMSDLPDAWFKLMATLAILCGSGAVTIPILHLTAKDRVVTELLTTGISFPMTCPRCQRSQEISIGRSKCSACGLKFSIEIEEEHCGKCGYPLYQIRSGQCPECGTPFLADAAQLPTAVPSA